MLRTIRAFWHDQRGIALILVAVTLPAIIGFSLLAIDMSRVNNLHNDLQKGADALALATAAELDGKSDSITRADFALATLVSNKYGFSTTPGPPATLAAAGVTRRYLKSLPATDNLAIAAANVITDEVGDATKARYVEIKVKPVGFSAIFPVSFLSPGASGSFNVGAVAVAGFSTSVCDFTPMFICNPYSSIQALGDTLRGNKRPMVALKAQGGGNKYGPGDYGFLNTPDGSQATPDLTNMFASTKPLTCYKDDGVDLAPGNVPPINAGINVRFDIYDKLDPATYPPAPNVRKGMAKQVDKQGNCSYVTPTGAPAANYMKLPQDKCFSAPGGCAGITGFSRLGNGVWDLPTYWSVNHGTSTLPADLPADSSRWTAYNYEITHPGLTNVAEQTLPQCNPQKASTDPKRRMIYVALLDCVANQVQGSHGPYPVQAFASVFVTEPAGSPPSADIYGEIIDITSKAGNGTLDNFLRDEVQLYR
jgi:Flp pilus assembly protein TadG